MSISESTTPPKPLPGTEKVDGEPTATSSGIQLTRDANILIRSFLPPSPPTPPQANVHPDSAPLPLPLCLPQIAVRPRFDSAFARGYNPSLEATGITQDALLKFVDGLNLAIVASPPLRVVDLAGKIIGFVPYHWAMVAGAIIQTAAQTSMHILSKTLTDRYLRAANLNLFKPRGLSVRLCTTPAMLLLLSHSEAPKKSKKDTLNKVGRGVGKVLLQIPLPMVHSVVRAVADKPTKVPTTGASGDPVNSPVMMRRLALTEGLALPVETSGMPPPARPEGVMDTMHSWGVKFDGAKEGRKERNIEQRRRALEEFERAGVVDPVRGLGRGLGMRLGLRSAVRPGISSSSSSSSNVSSESSGFSMKRLASQAVATFDGYQQEREIRVESMERSRRAALGGGGRPLPIIGPIFGPQMTRMEGKVANADLLESWDTEKVLWIVIMSSEYDAEIDGIEIAENPSDEEHIDEQTWKAEMEVERGELEDDIARETARDGVEEQGPASTSS